MPNRENRVVKYLITDDVDISGKGNTNGNLEYSSTIVRKYLFLLLLGNCPLTSIFILLKGCVALMSGTSSGLSK